MTNFLGNIAVVFEQLIKQGNAAAWPGYRVNKC